MEFTARGRPLTGGQKAILIAATLPMVAFGVAGGVGTYTNIKAIFPESATALGVVAGGEGATLVAALVYVGLTLLGQSSPKVLRTGLWMLPAIASGTGAFVAKTSSETVVYAVTPMAMCVSAEGLGLLARRIVVYHTGIDTEAQRRNAETMQRLAYQRARAAGHPILWARKCSELRSWRLARRVGTGDTELGGQLLTVQRGRLTAGADAALADMFAPAVTPALAATVTPPLPTGDGRDGAETAAVTKSAAPQTEGTGPVTELAGPGQGVSGCAGAVTHPVTQVTVGSVDPASRSAKTVTNAVTPAVTDGVTETVTDSGVTQESVTGTVTRPVTHAAAVTDGAVTGGSVPEVPERVITLAEIAAVAGVTTPEPGERLSDTQLVVVLRYLRYSEDPPLSYRQAQDAFRGAGYVGGEQRVRKAWGALMSHEESEAFAAAEPDRTEEGDEEDEEEPEAGPRS